MTNGETPVMAPSGITPQSFLAAIIAAQKSDCNCEVVKILKKMGDDMVKQELGG